MMAITTIHLDKFLLVLIGILATIVCVSAIESLSSHSPPSSASSSSSSVTRSSPSISSERIRSKSLYGGIPYAFILDNGALKENPNRFDQLNRDYYYDGASYTLMNDDESRMNSFQKRGVSLFRLFQDCLILFGEIINESFFSLFQISKKKTIRKE
ncbi:G-protein coupled receptor Mth2 [Sarcoptes scabiei]|nr:G-protein coupled receptor Mth2 [Sarcoptes scabiei]